MFTLYIYIIFILKSAIVFKQCAMSRHFEKSMKYSTGKFPNLSSFHFFLRVYEHKGFKKKRL